MRAKAQTIKNLLAYARKTAVFNTLKNSWKKLVVTSVSRPFRRLFKVAALAAFIGFFVIIEIHYFTLINIYGKRDMTDTQINNEFIRILRSRLYDYSTKERTIGGR
jgi:hypothetical protein